MINFKEMKGKIIVSIIGNRYRNIYHEIFVLKKITMFMTVFEFECGYICDDNDFEHMECID